jgi:hypothetical protein
VWNAVCGILLEPKLLIAALESDYRGELNSQLESQVQYLEKQVAEKQIEDEKLCRAYMSDVFDESEYAARRKLLKAELQKLAEELEAIRRQMLTEEQFEEKKSQSLEICQQAQDSGLTATAPFEFKRRLIKTLVDRIVLNTNEDWFRIEGVLTGTYPLTDTIVSGPGCTWSGRQNTGSRTTGVAARLH